MSIITELLMTRPERELYRAELAYQKKAIEQAAHYTTAWSESLSPLNDDGEIWERITGTRKLPEAMTESVRLKLVENMRHGYYEKGHVTSILDAFPTYGVGEGVTFKAVDEDAETQDAINDYVEEYLPTSLIQEMFLRLVRDGELFRFCVPGRKPVFYEPEHFTQTAENINTAGGIEKDADGEVVGYLYTVNTKTTRLRPDYMIHLKLRVDASERRGVPWITPGTFKDIIELENLEKAIYWQTNIRSMLAINYKVDGSPAQVNTIRSQNTGTGDNKQKGYRPGMIMHSSPGVGIEFAAPNVQAGDTLQVVRMRRLKIAAAVHLPEFIAFADASNANYASTKEAAVEAWAGVAYIRGKIAEALEKEIDLHLSNKISRGELKGTSYKTQWVDKNETDEFGQEKKGKERAQTVVPRSTKAQIVFPPFRQDDAGQQAAAIASDINVGIVSKATASGKRGYDWQNEEPLIEQEKAKGRDEFNAMRDRLQVEKFGGGEEKPEEEKSEEDKGKENPFAPKE